MSLNAGTDPTIAITATADNLTGFNLVGNPFAHIISSETVNGSVSKSTQAVSGVYMLRLINGENVKVQKIVVK